MWEGQKIKMGRPALWGLGGTICRQVDLAWAMFKKLDDIFSQISQKSACHMILNFIKLTALTIAHTTHLSSWQIQDSVLPIFNHLNNETSWIYWFWSLCCPWGVFGKYSWKFSCIELLVFGEWKFFHLVSLFLCDPRLYQVNRKNETECLFHRYRAEHTVPPNLLWFLDLVTHRHSSPST